MTALIDMRSLGTHNPFMAALPSPDPLQPYFDGSALYGDDFEGEQLARWYAGEREGYADHVANRTEAYRYKYHAINRHYAYRHLRGLTDLRVLGLGSAYGDELAPIARQAASFDIVEPSDQFSGAREIGGVPARYHKPAESGALAFPDATFDVVVNFSVLHHIANVSTVVGEMHRVLKPGGFYLVREPIVSMGDWRQPRRGLTKNERGIPYSIFMDLLSEAGFAIQRASLFDFGPFVRLVDNMGRDCHGDMRLTLMDRALSILFGFNRKYHRTRLIDKFGPASVFIVARKP